MDSQQFHPHPSVLPGFETGENRAPDPRLFTHRRPERAFRRPPPGPGAVGRGEVQEGRASPGARVLAGEKSAWGDVIGLLVALAVAALIWAGALSVLGRLRSRPYDQPAPLYGDGDFFRPR